jgi:hypothetical protein
MTRTSARPLRITALIIFFLVGALISKDDFSQTVMITRLRFVLCSSSQNSCGN